MGLSRLILGSLDEAKCLRGVFPLFSLGEGKMSACQIRFESIAPGMTFYAEVKLSEQKARFAFWSRQCVLSLKKFTMDPGQIMDPPSRPTVCQNTTETCSHSLQKKKSKSDWIFFWSVSVTSLAEDCGLWNHRGRWGGRGGSTILVRGAQQSFDPWGTLSSKFAQNRGFPLHCLKTAWFWTNLGDKGVGPLDVQGKDNQMFQIGSPEWCFCWSSTQKYD